MNKIKFCFAFLICLISLLCAYPSFAQGSVKAHIVGENITIKGGFSEGNIDVNIIIPEKDISFDEYTKLSDHEKITKTKYIKQVTLADNGTFELTFPFSGGDGVYTVAAISLNDTAFDYVTINSVFDSEKIDELSTTSYAPYLKQYNFTTENQYLSGYHGGEGGQKGFAMEISPVNSKLVFFGTDTSGIWKSEDGGNTWRSSSVGLGNLGTVAILCDKNNEDIVYAAVCPNQTGYPTKVNDKTGIYVSYDKGATWNLEQRLDFYRHHTKSLFAYHNNTIYCAGHNGDIYKRLSKGSWELVYDYDGEMIYNFYISNDKFYLATKDNGVMISEDFGESFTKNTNDFDVANVLSIAINPIDKNNVFAVTPNYLYKSTNGGESFAQFKRCSQLQSSLTDSFGQVFFGGEIGGRARLYVQLYSISYPLRYSDDFGESFNKMVIDTSEGFMSNKTGYGCEPVEVNLNNPNEIISSMDGEIYKSVDGGKSFFASSSAFSGLRVMDIAFNPDDDNDILFAVMDFGLVKTVSKNLGEEYPLTKYIPLRYNQKGASRAIARNPFDENNILVNVGQASTGFVLKESKDNGETFENITATEGYNTTNIYYNKEKEGVIYAKEIISYDGGVTWQKSDYLIYAVSPINGNIVYGVGNNKIYKSSDMGKTWSELYPISDGFQDITPDLEIEDKLYVGCYSGGVTIYENGTYKTINTSTDGYSMNYIYDVAQNQKNPKHLLAGGVNNSKLAPTDGIFESYDKGESWHLVKGLPHGRDIWKINFHPNGKKAYISTSSGTYIYEHEKYINTDILADGFEQKNISGIDYIDFNMYNVTNEYKKVKVISALYDKQKNGLLKTSFEEFNLAPLTKKAAKVKYQEDENTSQKVYFWNSFENIFPYMQYTPW